MAIYRSDQALVTFGAEAAHGGYQELIKEAGSSNNTGELEGAHAAGSRSLLMTAGTASALAIGDFVVIGYANAGGDLGDTATEIRRVTGKDGDRIYLNAPTGFYHADNADVNEFTVGSGIHATYPTAPSTVATWPIYGNAIKFIPGIYDTVDVPDMETAFNPTYALGSTAKRNATFIYKGEQAFNGGIPAFTVLNGWPLRFPIGKLVTLPSSVAAEDTSTGTATYNDSTAVTWRKGDMIINLPAQGSNVPYDALEINHATTASNRNLVMITHTDKNEVVQVIEVIDASNKIVRLSHPLRFEHISTADDTFTAHVLSDLSTRTYTHTITEESDLDSVSMHVHMRDSGETAANDFDRRFYGGRIGTSVIAGEEAGMLTMSWDGMQFMGMVHNQQKDVNFDGTGPSLYLPRFNFMQTITDTEAWVPPKDVTEALPLGTASDPYLFSQGQITMFGNVIATIRSFALTINNSPEARYYTGSQGGNRDRGPYEIINQRRDYTLAMTAVEPVSRAASATAGFDYDYDGGSTADTVSVDYGDGSGNSIFKEMLMEGDYSGVSGTSPRGLAFEIILSKDGLYDSGTNYIKIEPDFSSGTRGFALSDQGMFIQSAKYNLDGSSPIQADLDILLRSVKITVVDNNPIYP
jgi:hypothetical protein